MIEEKTIYCSPSPRFFATIKEPGTKKQIGLDKGPVRIYQKGDTLYYTQSNEAVPVGFNIVAIRKVGVTQNRLQVTIPPDWYKKYCVSTKKVIVDYQDIGLYVKPCK